MDTFESYGPGAIPPPMLSFEPTRPSPPRLHWGWVLALNVVTLGIFGIIWMIVQANWVRKMRGKSTAFVLFLVYVGIIPAYMILLFIVFMFGLPTDDPIVSTSQGIVKVVMWVLGLMAIFTLRSELEQSPINIPLSGVMTFFFSSIYFQYNLWDYEVESGGGLPTSGVLGLSQPGS
jgi:hypothetical protein